jgi:hypothetical protein
MIVFLPECNSVGVISRLILVVFIATLKKQPHTLFSSTNMQRKFGERSSHYIIFSYAGNSTPATRPGYLIFWLEHL